MKVIKVVSFIDKKGLTEENVLEPKPGKREVLVKVEVSGVGVYPK